MPHQYPDSQRDFQIELHLQHSFILMNLDSQYQKYNEGLHLIEAADLLFERRDYQNTVTCVFEGLGWIHLSGITKSDYTILAVERTKKILGTIRGKLFQEYRLSSEQMSIYREIAEIFLDSDDLENAIEIIYSADAVPNWQHPQIKPRF